MKSPEVMFYPSYLAVRLIGKVLFGAIHAVYNKWSTPQITNLECVKINKCTCIVTCSEV